MVSKKRLKKIAGFSWMLLVFGAPQTGWAEGAKAKGDQARIQREKARFHQITKTLRDSLRAIERATRGWNELTEMPVPEVEASYIRGQFAMVMFKGEAGHTQTAFGTIEEIPFGTARNEKIGEVLVLRAPDGQTIKIAQDNISSVKVNLSSSEFGLSKKNVTRRFSNEKWRNADDLLNKIELEEGGMKVVDQAVSNRRVAFLIENGITHKREVVEGYVLHLGYSRDMGESKATNGTMRLTEALLGQHGKSVFDSNPVGIASFYDTVVLTDQGIKFIDVSPRLISKTPILGMWIAKGDRLEPSKLRKVSVEEIEGAKKEFESQTSIYTLRNKGE